MILNNADIQNLERRFRANLINSIGGFKSLTLIGTKSIDGTENLALFSSFFHLGSHPALCGLIIRPGLPKKNTLGNIINTRVYTINHVMPDFLKKAHQCSAKYDEGVNEFGETGLTAEYIDDVYAPFVQESKVKFSCELVQKTDIELNDTYLVIGQIRKIILPENIVGNDGLVNLEDAETVTCSGLDTYHTTHKICRLSYAKVNEEIFEI
jgi:flavin reductase (DIM6/NTAB) family NADH-FMN oxidoreductase RutF